MARQRSSVIVNVTNITHYWRMYKGGTGNVADLRDYSGECSSMDFCGGPLGVLKSYGAGDILAPPGVDNERDKLFHLCSPAGEINNIGPDTGEGFCPDHPTIDSDQAWQGRGVVDVITGKFRKLKWSDIGDGLVGYRYRSDAFGGVLARWGDANKYIDPVVCNPGDYLFVEIYAEGYTDYTFQEGSLIPLVRIGAARCGNVSGGIYHDGGKSQGVMVYGKTGIVVRVPAGAKSGPLRVWGRRGSTTWIGSRYDIQTEADFGGDKSEAPVPILVMDEASAVCEEAYQCGRTNTSELESMVNPFGALTNAGDTVQIGANAFDGGGNVKKSSFCKAGTAWPVGMSAQQFHFLSAHGKEFTFRVTMAANAGHYGPAIGSMILMAGTAFMMGGLGGALLGMGIISQISVYGGLILHEMSKASGGSSFFRMHRTHDPGGEEYRGQGEEDVTQARDSQFGRVTFGKVMETNQSSSVSTHFYWDLSRARHVCDNSLHDSVARTNNTVKIRGVDTGSAYLNCAAPISVLNADGSENRKMIVAESYAPGQGDKPDGVVMYPDGAGGYVDKAGNPIADSPDYWGDLGLTSGPGNSNECFWDKGDGKWWQTAIDSPNQYMRNTTGRPHTAADPHVFESTNVYGTAAGTEWRYPWEKKSNAQAHDLPTLGEQRFWGGMTPLTSPPSIRNLSYECLSQDVQPRMGDDHDFYDLTRSEGLTNAGTLWFPRLFIRAIGKGHMTTVSSFLYDENMKCLSCSATAWGHDARYCMRNKSSLGYGGWFFGQKSKPSFFAGGRDLRKSVANYSTSSLLNIVPYSPNDPAPHIARYFSVEDLSMHDVSKFKAGYHYGGWPISHLSATASYERQPGSACFINEVYVDKAIDPNHPKATNVAEKIGTEDPNPHDLYGHGYEMWDGGCIPSYAKNEVNAWDIFHGNIKKYDNMRNAAQFTLTERNDLIHIVGTMSPAHWQNFDWGKVLPVGPHHEFHSGDTVVLRISPNTTKTSVPTRAVRLRKMNDDSMEYWRGNGINKNGNVAGAVGAAMVGDDTDITHFNFYKIGAGSGSRKLGPASLIMRNVRKVAGAAGLVDGSWIDHMDAGALGKSAQTCMDFYDLDKINSSWRKALVGASLGAPVDSGLKIMGAEYIDGWNSILSVQSKLHGNDTYTSGFFKNLRRVTFGRNGPECRFMVNNLQSGRWTKLIGGDELNSNSGKYDSSFVLARQADLAKVQKSLDNWIAHRASCTAAKWGSMCPPKNPNDDQILKDWQFEVQKIKWDIEKAQSYMKWADASKRIAVAGGDTHLMEQQIAIGLPHSVQSGSGTSNGPNEGDHDRDLTTDYLWLYFEELSHGRTECIPENDEKAKKERTGLTAGGMKSTSYISIGVPINIYNANKPYFVNRNELSTNWGMPSMLPSESLTQEKGDGVGTYAGW